MLKMITIVCCTILVLSCTDSSFLPFEDKINQCWTKAELKKSDFIFIVPNQGCGDCIASVKNFYFEHRNNQALKFIFTNVISFKDLKNKDILESTNTILDKESSILKLYPPDKKLYPCILELKDGKILNIYYQSPDENAIGFVLKSLKKVKSE